MRRVSGLLLVFILALLQTNLSPTASAQGEREKQAGGEQKEEQPQRQQTYVESLFEFFRRGKVIELPDFPTTKVFDEFLKGWARHEGLTVEDLQRQMKERGITSYLLDLLKRGHLSLVEFANLMDINWTQAFQMAYSSGAAQLSDEALEMLLGKATKTVETLRRDKQIIVKEIAYRSSIDDLYPLYAEIAYDPTRRRLPVLVVQHGDYPGTRIVMIPSAYALAKRGLFVIAVSKRQRDGSAGKGDAWGKELYDIYDAVEYVKKSYALYVDPTNINITGGSGGGMDTIGAVVRFPDSFRVAAAFFGPPDLDHWFRSNMGTITILKDLTRLGGQYGGAWSLFSQMIEGIGGLPDEVPDHYMARNNVLGAVNNPYTQIHLFWDAEDGAVPSLTERNQAYYEAALRLGFTNVHLHFSRRGDPIRFLHWGVPDNSFAWHYFLPPIMSRTHPEPVLSSAGRLVVLGFVKTRPFLIVLGEGNNAVAQVDYRVGARRVVFQFKRLSQRKDVQGRLTFYNQERARWKVYVNDAVVQEAVAAKEVVIEFGLDDTVRVEKVER